MANVDGAYSGTDDLLVGDIQLQTQQGDGTKMIRSQADDIDAQLGHIYVTPFDIEDTPRNRPSRLLLKKINNLLASGRLLLDMTAGGSDDQPNALGLQYLREGLGLLKEIQNGKIVLAGAQRHDDEEAPGGPVIHNEDQVSLVEQFYNPRLRSQMSLFSSGPYSGNG